MKKARSFAWIGLLFAVCWAGFAQVGAPASSGDLPSSVTLFLKSRCASEGCHSGKYAAQSLSFEPDKVRAAIDRPSQENPSLKIIDSANPESSYLLMKVRGGKGISGSRMPLGQNPLSAAEIETLRTGLMTLKKKAADPADPSPYGSEGAFPRPASAQDRGTAGTAPAPSKPPFWGVRLIDLPTTTMMDKGHLLARISLKFLPRVGSGYATFYGFDGPAAFLFSLGYGITDNVSVTLGRSNTYQEFEAYASWLAVEQGERYNLPFSATLHAGVSWASQEIEGESSFAGRRFKLNAQLSVSRRMTSRWSVLVVPSLSTNTDHFDPNPRTNVALGVGSRYVFWDDASVLVEWIPIITGAKVRENAWGLGLEKKLGGHVFQLFAVNSVGLTASQFITGGDLRLRDLAFRFGLTIYRTF